MSPCLFVDVADVDADVYLGSQLASGAFGVVKKIGDFFVAFAFVAFSNI